MNKRFLAIAIAASLAVSSNVMADGVEIYGVAHASLNNISADDNSGAIDRWTVTSNNSRLGFKGSEDLGGGLKAVYKMEFGVDIADAGTISGRNQYVGLSGGMGTVLLGRHDTAVKMVEGKFDVFNDTVADMQQAVSGQNRVPNVIGYHSPKMGGIQMIAQLMPGEGVACGTDVCDGIADGTSLSFTYEADAIYVGLGIDSGDLVNDDIRLVATYKTDVLMAGFIYNTVSDEFDADYADDETSIGISGKYTFGNYAVKGMLIQLTSSEGIENDDGDAFTLGFDMNMSARTTAYALYNMYSPDADNADISTLSLGINHSF